MTWLRSIRGRSRRERIRNEKTREEDGAEETVIYRRLKEEDLFYTWFGHVERMDGKRLPIAALHGHAYERRKK